MAYNQMSLVPDIAVFVSTEQGQSMLQLQDSTGSPMLLHAMSMTPLDQVEARAALHRVH